MNPKSYLPKKKNLEMEKERTNEQSGILNVRETFTSPQKGWKGNQLARQARMTREGGDRRQSFLGKAITSPTSWKRAGLMPGSLHYTQQGIFCHPPWPGRENLKPHGGFL